MDTILKEEPKPKLEQLARNIECAIDWRSCKMCPAIHGRALKFLGIVAVVDADVPLSRMYLLIFNSVRLSLGLWVQLIVLPQKTNIQKACIPLLAFPELDVVDQPRDRIRIS